MKRLKTSSSKPKTISLNGIVAGWLSFSIIGFLDAAYLTIQHYRGNWLECGPVFGCDAVVNSRFAVIGGIPLALLGALYYLSILLLTVAYCDRKNHRVLAVVSKLTTIGFLASLILLYLQAVEIRSFCLYCLISALSSTGLFVLTMMYRYRLKMGDSAASGFSTDD